MPDADFFESIGLLTRRGFLDAATCARLRDEVRAGPTRKATVLEKGRVYDVDESTRSTDWADVSDEATALVKERLEGVVQDVGSHYGLPLTHWQTPQFLVYRTGDFFHLHRDNSGEVADVPELVGARRVAAVIFLNGEGDPASSDSFRGGALTFYDLFDRPEGRMVGFPLVAEEGLLVTFPANVLHEVTPVEAGERYTIVTWFVT